MFRFALFALAAAVAVPAAADPPPAPADAPAPPAPAPLTPEQLASDPRMIAAIRHANAMADHKCGENVGGITDLATKAEAQRCRRRMIATAKLDAEGEIEGH
jgi:hypothetical protein